MTIEEMLEEFHAKWEQPPIGVTMPTEDRQWQRLSMLLSETQELSEAISRQDTIGIADALGDIAYVLFGTAFTHGIPLTEVIAEIHRSNMTKTLGPNEKLIKGPDYSPPRLVPILEEHGWDGR